MSTHPLPKLNLDSSALFHSKSFVQMLSRSSQTRERGIPYVRFKCVRTCVFAYMVATHLTGRAKNNGYNEMGIAVIQDSVV